MLPDMNTHPLLEEIEAFIATHEIAESTFGREALGDWRFISDLRGEGGKKPRRVWPETETAIRRFMSAYPNHEKWVPTPRKKTAA